MLIRKLTQEDFLHVKEIYAHGIKTGNATFEVDLPDWSGWQTKFLLHMSFVSEEDGIVKGWGALSQLSARSVYSGVCEVSIYVHPEFQGHGIGGSLLHHLIVCSEEHDIWTLQAGIFPENIGSIHLHKKLGFREVGYRERIGKLNGEWRNTLLFERRSKNVGTK